MPDELAHIVRPANKIKNAQWGEEIVALCGAYIRKPAAADSQICRSCFTVNVSQDYTANNAAFQAETVRALAEGVEKGKTTGKDEAMAELRSAAEKRSAEKKTKKARRKRLRRRAPAEA